GGGGFRDAVERDQGQRDEQQRGSGSDDHGGAEHRAGVGVVLADPRQPEQAAGAGRRAGEQQRPGADPGHKLSDSARCNEEGGGEREVGDAGPQGRVSPHGLHEDGEEEEHAEDEDAHAGVAQVGAGAEAVPQQSERQCGLRVSMTANAASSITAATNDATTLASPQWETPFGLVAALTRP